MKNGVPDFVIQQIPIPMDEDPKTGWQRRVFFLGPTSFLNELCIHAGVLSAHVTPHPPHCHEHEELHISLSENLEFVFCETDSGSEKARPIDNGSVFYTRSNIPHSFRNTASQPAAYLHFRWKSKSEATRTEMKRLQFYYSPAGQREMSSSPGRDGVDVIELYNGPSLYLTRFRALFVRMAAGGVIPLHRHSHETIFAFVSGSVGFLGRNVDAPGFAFTGTQMPHSIINQCTETAQFYAFELHQEA